MQVQANGISVEVDDQGPVSADPLVLIMGLGMQLTAWPEPLVQMLVSRGFRVIRLDNRDAGLSQGFDHLGMPNLTWAALLHAAHLPVKSPYALADMAADTLGVLDVLGLRQAHIVGASMGGMVAQHVAAAQPERVKSLTLMMTSSGARQLPQAPWRVRRILLSRPQGRQPDAVLHHLLRVMRVIASPAYPADEAQLRQRLQASIARAWRPAGTARQLAAVVADGDRSALLRRIRCATRIIHGLEDPLVPVAAGHDLLKKLPGAVADFVPGMGHDLPAQLLERFADGMAENARR